MQTKQDKVNQVIQNTPGQWTQCDIRRTLEAQYPNNQYVSWAADHHVCVAVRQGLARVVDTGAYGTRIYETTHIREEA